MICKHIFFVFVIASLFLKMSIGFIFLWFCMHMFAFRPKRIIYYCLYSNLWIFFNTHRWTSSNFFTSFWDYESKPIQNAQSDDNIYLCKGIVFSALSSTTSLMCTGILIGFGGV